MVAQKASIGQIAQAGAMVAVISAVVNAVIYLIASAMGFFPSSVVTPAGQPLSIAPVVILSVLGSIGAAIGYALCVRFVPNPNRAFLILAVVVFVLMFFAPFGIQNAPIGMLVSLQLTHVVVAGLAVYFLTRLTRA
jgi:hypothetical protein